MDAMFQQQQVKGRFKVTTTICAKVGLVHTCIRIKPYPQIVLSKLVQLILHFPLKLPHSHVFFYIPFISYDIDYHS